MKQQRLQATEAADPHETMARMARMAMIATLLPLRAPTVQYLRLIMIQYDTVGSHSCYDHISTYSSYSIQYDTSV